MNAERNYTQEVIALADTVLASLNPDCRVAIDIRDAKARLQLKDSATVSPLKSGSVREAAEEAVDEIYRRCNPRNNPAASHGMISKPHMTELVAQAFEGFEKIDLVSANKFLRSLAEKEDAGLSIVGAYGTVTERLHAAQADNAKLREESRRLELERDQFKAWYETQTVRIDNAQADNAKKREDVERITSGYHRRADELDAQYRELISLRTQLKDMTAQFFAVSQEGAKLKALLSDALDELPLTDCDGRKNRVVIDLAQQIKAAPQYSRAAEVGKGGQL